MRRISWQRNVIIVGLSVALVALVAALIVPSHMPRMVITLGPPEAYAAGDADYSLDGINDNVQAQAALNALPAAGGLLHFKVGTYSFSATVTRAIANVTIEGEGSGTVINYNASSPVFTAGGNNWVVRDIKTDTGGLNMGATSGWQWNNVTINTTLWAFRTPNAVISGDDLTISGNTSSAPSLLLDSTPQSGTGTRHGGNIIWDFQRVNAELYDTIGYLYLYSRNTNNVRKDMGEFKLMNISNTAAAEQARWVFAATWNSVLETLGTWDYSNGLIINTPLRLNGVTLSANFTELNYVAGVTSAIQTQINTKAPTASPTFTGLMGGISASGIQLINTQSLRNNLNTGYIYFVGGSDNTSGDGASLTLYGKSAAQTGAVRVATPNALTNANVLRLNLTGGTDTAIATWSNTTQTWSSYGAGTLTTDGAGAITAVSDTRLKNVTGNFTAGLRELGMLQPIRYQWNNLSGLDKLNTYAGFSAQNIKLYIPEAIGIDPDGYYTLSDRPLIAALVNAVKELRNEIDILRAEAKLLARDWSVSPTTDDSKNIKSYPKPPKGMHDP